MLLSLKNAPRPARVKRLPAASPRSLRAGSNKKADPAQAVDMLEGLLASADALCARMRTMLELEAPRVVVSDHRDLLVFDAREISRFYAAGKYTAFRAGECEFFITETLASLHNRLERLGFMRVHRKELVNVHHITRVRRLKDLGNALLKDGQEAQVSRKMVTPLCERLIAQHP